MPRRLLHLVLVLALTACGGGGNGTLDPPPNPPPAPPPPPPAPATTAAAPEPPDLDRLGVPKFAGHDYLDPATIEAISRFRSSAGHDYHDGLETCRSMKHYLRPRAGTDWTTVAIYAPVTGAIDRTRPDSYGTQLVIASSSQPAFRFILFHVATAAGVDSGTAGQLLGHHIGNQTMTDIAVGVDTPTGYRLVSWFETLTDSVFATYQARGVTDRSALVITRAARDADPLSCNGEAFTATGSLESWVLLQP